MKRYFFTDINKLAEFLNLSPNKRKKLLSSPFKIPLYLAKKIKKNCLSDPIFLQFVPLQDENIIDNKFSKDPLDEGKFQTGKLLQKYKKRVLLLCSHQCAMNCRYCFRKFSSFQTNVDFSNEIKEIQADRTLEEIILSGGDPLSLSNSTLEQLLHELQNISHIQRIRFHTRYIIGDPDRINNRFLQILKKCNKQIFFIFQINHVNELDEKILKKLSQIQKLKIPIMTQTVLLKGINDDLKSLLHLFTALINNGIIPYYLHQLDRVSGTAHFEVSIKKGKKLIEQLQTVLPGYAIAKYVQEIPHSLSKTII